MIQNGHGITGKENAGLEQVMPLAAMFLCVVIFEILEKTTMFDAAGDAYVVQQPHRATASPVRAARSIPQRLGDNACDIGDPLAMPDFRYADQIKNMR